MKHYLLSAVFFAGTLSSAIAADLTPVYAPPVVSAPAAFNWSGFYLGGNVGGVWSDASATDLEGYNTVRGERYSLDDRGFLGGVQAGYNWQFDRFVAGVEGDFGSMSIDRTVLQPSSPVGDTKSSIDANYYLALTARAGFAIDKTLIYAKGGFAYLNADVSTIDDCSVGSCGRGLLAARGDNFTGYTLGAGVEHAFTPNWTAKLEYSYYDFGSVRANDPGTPRYGYDFDLRAHTVRVGLNYKF